MQVRFRLFKPNKGEVGDLDWRADTNSQIGSGRVVFIVHGYFESPDSSPWMFSLGEGYTKGGNDVVLVDWRHANQGQVRSWSADS